MQLFGIYSMIMKKKIFEEVNILEGIAIILVIMGHAFTNHPIDI